MEKEYGKVSPMDVYLRVISSSPGNPFVKSANINVRITDSIIISTINQEIRCQTLKF
jgi:hypothetical protein